MVAIRGRWEQEKSGVEQKYIFRKSREEWGEVEGVGGGGVGSNQEFGVGRDLV